MTETVNPVRNATPHNNKGDVFQSFDVSDFPVPGGRDEVWRFIPLRRLRGLHDGTFAPVAEVQVRVDAPEAVEVEQVAPSDDRLRVAGGPVDRVAAQAWSAAETATIISVPADVVLEEPITITITGAGLDATTFATILVETGRHSEATVLVRYEGSGTHADNLNWHIGEGSHVNAVVDTQWERDAVHLGQQSIKVNRDSRLHHTVAAFGGEVVRITPRVTFTEPGADVELDGVYFADAGQYIENRMLVDHSVPNCRSNVLYKGALQGDRGSELPEARTCWVGDVLIRANAKGTDTYETNRNLVLTDGARADAVPNLEIETGEISGAGHAATVGRFDDDQLFYLQSRGIPEREATRLIIRGFFNEVLNQIPVESVRDELIARVAGELELSNN
ncbi:Fe-S cluster assembly protein SufD [Corynebacterium bouchesdurhonense]|uniref:Fe-S cluster assembly protein SufD n=1 Tax=Corynebacterium bouchesdurhonense TaxID=1720192 RepID=UPI0008340D22|nr:Fe-S cluster assembly protein SufD [Corynebacterium bouchesdurhonense]